MNTSPKSVVMAWVEAFNAADPDALASLYHSDATNHQVAYEPLHGREATKHLFETEFARARMVCNIEQIFEDGEWAILEWSDPLGLRGCGFFQIENGKIAFQRGYFDRLKFYEINGIPLDQVIAS